MKPALKNWAPTLLVTLGLVAATPMWADTFSYNYDFQDGGTVAGTFTGTLTGSDVDNLDFGSLTMTIDGTAINSSFHTVFPSTTVSFDPTHNDFFFIASDPFYDGTAFVYFPGGIEDLWMENGLILGQHADPNPSALGSWSLVDLSTSKSVPDTGTTTALGAISAASLFGLRRRFTRVLEQAS